MHRLLINLRHNGVEYPKGTEVDLDAIGLDGKSMVAEGDAEAVLPGDSGTPKAEARETAKEGTQVGGSLGSAQTMDRKARGDGDR